MKKLLMAWYRRYFSDPQALVLLLILIATFIVFANFGQILAPVFAGLVIAYLLEGMVIRLEKIQCPHWLAVTIVYLVFIGFFVIALFIILPIIMRQLSNLVADLPTMLSRGQALVMELPAKYPDYVSDAQLHSIANQLKLGIGRVGQAILSFSLASIPSVIAIILYVVLVPLLVFFFLLDRDKLLHWCLSNLPKNKQLLTKIWKNVNRQLGNYIRGKVLEIIIIAFITYIAFYFMHLPFALLLSVLVGISVVIPFVGVAVVTIPVLVIGYLQWGWSADFAYLVIIYGLICLFDANILVPILFAGAVNLHPVAIIIAILFFGGLWGFWGIFFAIPLANLVQAILNAWPRNENINIPDTIK